MLSSRLMEARPVRMVAIACCKSLTAFSMRLLELASISLTELKACPARAEGSVFISVLVNERADRFSGRHTHYIASCIQIENNDREVVIAAHGHGRSVHHTQALGQHL